MKRVFVDVKGTLLIMEITKRQPTYANLMLVFFTYHTQSYSVHFTSRTDNDRWLKKENGGSTRHYEIHVERTIGSTKPDSQEEVTKCRSIFVLYRSLASSLQ